MIVPVFPLPDLVFFPKTVIPLHIFEERYRLMTREALEGERRIALVLLRQGWESAYRGSPPVHEVACLGKIESHEELEEGKYNIVLSGVARVRLVREVRSIPYRLAEAELIRELVYDDEGVDVIRRQNQLGGLFTRYTELSTKGKYRAVELVPQLGFETLVNVVATIVNLPASEKQELLEMDDLFRRCDVLIPLFRRQLEALSLVRGYEHLKPADPNRN